MRSHFSHELPIIKYRHVFLGLSAVFIVLSLAGLLVRGLVFGIEFSGGTEIDFYNTGSISIDQMRNALSEAQEGSATVQTTLTDGSA
ncbi:MAG: protein translocase subunit SecF, partial [Atopobium minutum]|nr:protein translocase subunit SecF [Atopobium minutum]